MSKFDEDFWQREVLPAVNLSQKQWDKIRFADFKADGTPEDPEVTELLKQCEISVNSGDAKVMVNGKWVKFTTDLKNFGDEL